MFVLGIETSCDETAVSVVRNGNRICSNAVSSSLAFHKRYKGIIPEIASRLHVETIDSVLKDALTEAGVGLNQIKLIAVTSHPGLPGSLRVGMAFGRGLSFALGVPLACINHLHAHLYASFLNGRRRPRFPFIGLVVSGGHTSLFCVNSFFDIELIGSTQDDACGEAFDKVAAILGLGYPGGPAIEKLAKKGNPKSIEFRCSNTKQPLNFSFSGIKTAVLYRVSGKGQRAPGIADVAASFQEVVIDTLIKKSILACKTRNINRLVVGGGVAINNRLREKFTQQAKPNRINIYFSPKQLCGDNAAMIAGLGYRIRTAI